MVAVDAKKQETWMVFQIYFQLINYFLSLSASKMEEHPQSPDNVIAGFIHDQFFDIKGVKCGLPGCTTLKARSSSIFTSSLTLKLCANKLRLWAMKAIQLYQLENQLKKKLQTNKEAFPLDAVNCYQQFVLCIHMVRYILYFPTRMVKFCKANVLLCYLFNIKATPGDMETAYDAV